MSAAETREEPSFPRLDLDLASSYYARIFLMPNHGHGVTPVLIFDGDDTLWDTMPLYTAAKTNLYEYLRSRECDSTEVAEFFEQEDLSNVAAMGFGLNRFEMSIRNTIGTFCPLTEEGDERAVDEFVTSIRDLIVGGPTPVASDAYQVLSDLSSYYRIILLTKGDRKTQQGRVASSGLEHLFEQVLIVAEKRRDTFAEILTSAHTSASDSWSIGNSLRSDVLPAIAKPCFLMTARPAMRAAREASGPSCSRSLW